MGLLATQRLKLFSYKPWTMSCIILINRWARKNAQDKSWACYTPIRRRKTSGCISVTGIPLSTSEAPRFSLPKAPPELLLELFPPTRTDVVPLFPTGKDREHSELLLLLCLVKSIGKKKLTNVNEYRSDAEPSGFTFRSCFHFCVQNASGLLFAG